MRNMSKKWNIAFLASTLSFLVLAAVSYATEYCIVNAMVGAAPYCPNEVWTTIFSAVALVSLAAFVYFRRKGER